MILSNRKVTSRELQIAMFCEICAEMTLTFELVLKDLLFVLKHTKDYLS